MTSKNAIQSSANDDGHFYGSSWQDDFLFHNARSLPRYGHLARKAIMHYAGERYNPQKDGIGTEVIVREIIHELITYKVFYKTKAYDWEWIDQTLRKAISGCLNLDLAFDQARIDQGFASNCMAPQQINWSAVH